MEKSNPNPASTKISAKDRAKQYPNVLHESRGKLFCTPCNEVLDHRRKSSVTRHLASGKHSKMLSAAADKKVKQLTFTATRNEFQLKMASREPSIAGPSLSTATSAVPVASSSTCNIEVQENVLAEVKDIMNDVYKKLSHQKTELNTFLKGKLEKNWEDLESSKTELVGVFGKTGAGKSSLINAIIGEKNLLPCGGVGNACTSVMIQVQANMTDKNYIAEIEFIPVKEWEEELWYFKNKSANEEGACNDDDDDDDDDGDGDDGDDDDDIKEKFSALYGEEGFKNSADVEDYMTDKNFRDIPEFLQSKPKTLICKNSSALSEEIVRYTRHVPEEDTQDSDGGRQYWPLVKCVTIKVPNASKLLQRFALVDLPGTGDCNKSRDEMWKKIVRNCAAVWIVSVKDRAVSAKEPWEILNETINLIGNGGECQSICFICTKSDVLGDSDEDLSKLDTAVRILRTNKIVKDKLLKTFEKKSSIKKHFHEKSDFFQVFSVSSKEFNKQHYLQKVDTEIPKLKRFLEDLSGRHSKTNNYVNGAYGILSLMKGAKTLGTDSFKAELCKKTSGHLETQLQEWYNKVDQSMTECYETFEKRLDEGVSLSKKRSENVLKHATTGKQGCGHHMKLNSLVQNNGSYKPKRKKGSKVNLNERLSKYMREKIDPEFSKTFPNEGRSGPIKEAINKFTLVTESLSDKYKAIALQMTFLKTEEEKLKTKLVNHIREEKKNIYSSLEESIQKSMQPCYAKAAAHSGTGMVANMRQEMEKHLNDSKSTMFKEAKKDMLDDVARLKDMLLKTLKEDMQTSIDQSLKKSVKSVPDVTEQYEKVKICHEKLEEEKERTAPRMRPVRTTSGSKRSPPRTGHQPCGNCSCCPQSADLEEFTNPHTRQIVHLETLTTCVTKDVIYAIQCPCSKLYIGKTSCQLKRRIMAHKSDIRGKAGSLGTHFTQCGHSENNLKFWAIEKVQGVDLYRKLSEAEARWIKDLDTVNTGLNENKA